MPGKLFVIPTPVGNMGDMTPRGVSTLNKCDLILAEDTRTSAPLLKAFDVDVPCRSFHKFNEHAAVSAIADRLEQGDTIGLISDAGTPGISDPGFMLTRECRARGIEVETLPGPTAFVPALVNSGLPCDRFSFEGFLPVKKGRATRLAEIAGDERTTVIYESPVRLVKTLEQLRDVCGADRAASVSREISKLHGETVNGTLEEIIEHFKTNNPRGEIVIVLGGRPAASRAGTHKNKYRDAEADGHSNCEP